MSILPIFIPHAGCPHQCVFCNQKRISGQSSATVQNAQRQIEKWLTWLKPSQENEAAFYGGSFTGLEPQLQEDLLNLTDTLLENGSIGRVRCSTRPDYIDKPRLERLKKHAVTTVELGVQSLDPRVLLVAERGHTVEQVYEAMQLLKEQGFTTGMQLMVGMPEQSFASLQYTVAQTLALAPDLVRIYHLLVVKDTPLAQKYIEGSYTPLSLDEAVEQSAYAYRQFTEAGIRVIRIGLQADDELCTPGNILAGPFHPSMGELVKSRYLRDELTPQLNKLYLAGKRELTITCPKKLVSKLVGMKKCNLAYWRELFPTVQINIESNREQNEITISSLQ